MSRLLSGSWVPTAVEIVAFDTLSGRPCVGFAKCVYLNVSRLRELITQDASPMPIFCRASAPVPVVDE